MLYSRIVQSADAVRMIFQWKGLAEIQVTGPKWLSKPSWAAELNWTSCWVIPGRKTRCSNKSMDTLIFWRSVILDAWIILNSRSKMWISNLELRWSCTSQTQASDKTPRKGLRKVEKMFQRQKNHELKKQYLKDSLNWRNAVKNLKTWRKISASSL